MHPVAKMIDKYVVKAFLREDDFSHILFCKFSFKELFFNLKGFEIATRMMKIYDPINNYCLCCHKTIHRFERHLKSKMHKINYQKKRPTLKNIRNNKDTEILI
jgi:hypothetical protein